MIHGLSHYSQRHGDVGGLNGLTFAAAALGFADDILYVFAESESQFRVDGFGNALNAGTSAEFAACAFRNAAHGLLKSVSLFPDETRGFGGLSFHSCTSST